MKKHNTIKEAMIESKRTRKIQPVKAQVGFEVKVNLSIRLDFDTLKSLKSRAEKLGLPYQTLINSVLKQYIDNPDLLTRIEALEQAQKNKAG